MTDTIDDLLSAYDPPVREIALKLRDVILEEFPSAVEQVDMPAKLIGYGYDRTYKGLVCGIALQKSYVNLMFSKGTEMPDPDGLLEGTGKRARHIKMRTLEDIDRAGVRPMLTVAMQATQADLQRSKKIDRP
jgi:hypothetical protein